MNDIATLLIGFFAIAANSILLMYIFPFRFNPRVSIALVVFLVVSHFTVLLNLSPANLDMGGLRGLIYFPVFMILLKGSFFQKAFVYSLQAVLTVSSALLIREISRFLFAEEHIGYSISRLAMVVAAYFFYVAAVIKKRSVIYDKLFLYGNTREWILYSFAGMSAFFMIAISRLTKTDRLGSMFILVFILMSFSILIYAIVITHEKTKQKMEADFARSIVSSGRDHYQKMNEMNDKLRILRHDYKYHVSAAREMLRSGDSGGADNYLINVEHQLAAYEIKKYCENTVLNALITSYAERCAELNIDFSAKIVFPDSLGIPNYDMCIVLGNLLENALEACVKLNENRFIVLETHIKTAQLFIQVKNSFDGIVRDKNDLMISTKPNGGLGLRSVKEVLEHYGGDLLTEWKTDIFTVYAAVKIVDEY